MIYKNAERFINGCPYLPNRIKCFVVKDLDVAGVNTAHIEPMVHSGKGKIATPVHNAQSFNRRTLLTYNIRNSDTLSQVANRRGRQITSETNESRTKHWSSHKFVHPFPRSLPPTHASPRVQGGRTTLCCHPVLVSPITGALRPGR